MRLMLSNEQRHRTEGAGGSREYLIGDVRSLRYGVHQVAVAQTAAMGNNSAALRASKLLEDFGSIDAVIMCGIAGGVPFPSNSDEHVRLGDIVVSDKSGIVQYDLGKAQEDGFEHRNPPRPPSARLLESVQILEQDRFTGVRPWDKYVVAGLSKRNFVVPDLSTDVVLDGDGNPIAHPERTQPCPYVFHGPIASANVVQGNHRTRDELRDRFKVKAVEMEGSGIADATWEYEKAGYLVVRGICDYCDTRTKAFQTDNWKRYAALVAAAYVRSLIEVLPAGSMSGIPIPRALKISHEAQQLLVAAARGKRKTVTINSDMHGLHLGTGDGPIVDTEDDRRKAECRQWLEELVAANLIEDRWGFGQVYAVTSEGFLHVDRIEFIDETKQSDNSDSPN